MKSLFKDNQKGWVFIDALMGVVIVSVALTALLWTFSQNTKTTSSSQNLNEAIIIAQQTLEDLKIQDGSAGPLDLSAIPTTTARNNITFNLSAQPQAVTETGLNPKVIPIVITVSWTEPTTQVLMKTQIVNYYYVQ